MNKDCIVNNYRNELKEKILEYSEKEFYANGVRQVKMDNIANYLSISLNVHSMKSILLRKIYC